MRKNILLPLFIFTLGWINTAAQSNDPAVLAFQKSCTYENNKDFKNAITEIKNVFDIGSYEMNLRLGWLYYSNGSYTESCTYYAAAIQLRPYSIEAKLGYVYPLAALGNMGQVSSQYQEILKIDPQNSTANYRMAAILYDQKDYQKAFTYCEKVANLYPFDYSITLLYAWINLQMGKYSEAKLLFNKVLMISKDDSSALEGLKLIK